MPHEEPEPEYVEKLSKTMVLAQASLAGALLVGGNVVDCRNIRTAAVTLRCTYGAGPPSAVRVHLRYSPDGKSFDTVDYASFDADVTASAAVQETHIFDFPEFGYMHILAENLDATTAATALTVWVTRVKWGSAVSEGI